MLDLCAAPGGKSTQIGTALRGKGLLWSNEFVKSRTGSLLSNVERMGLRNCVVSSCYPETLCKRLAGWFDKVLVDAPCSGEGMFRRNPDAVKVTFSKIMDVPAGSQSESCRMVQAAKLATLPAASRRSRV